MEMNDRHAIVERLFVRAAQRLGGAGMLARRVRIPLSQLRHYLVGEAMPPEQVLLATVNVILDELPAIRREFPAEVWRSLSLP
jgi:hypothetical protein